jgi:hypothetical protein
MKCGTAHDSMNVQRHIVKEENRLFPQNAEPEYFDDEVHLLS